MDEFVLVLQQIDHIYQQIVPFSYLILFESLCNWGLSIY